MFLLFNNNNDLRLYYKIGYETWNEDDYMFIRTSCYSRDEAIQMFIDSFPALNNISVPINCAVVIQ